MILANSRRYRNEVSRLGGQVSGLIDDHIRSTGHVGFSLSTTDAAYGEGLQLLGKILSEPELGEREWKQAQGLLAATDSSVQRNIEAQAKERLMSLVFRKHPLRLPYRGLSTERKALSLEDVGQFYASHYSSNKTTIIVVGNVDHKRVLREVEQAFAGMQRLEFDAGPSMSEPIQFAQRQAAVLGGTDEDYRIFGWRTPPATFYKEHAALDLLQHIMHDRLQQRLAAGPEGQPLASDISVRSDLGTNWGVFHRPSPQYGGHGGKWRCLVWHSGCAEQSASRRPGPDELAIAKRNWQRKEALKLTQVGGIAADLARWGNVLGWPPLVSPTVRLERLSVDDIKRVMASYLHPKGANLSTVNLGPEPTPESTPQEGSDEGDDNTASERSTLTDVAPEEEALPFGARLIHATCPSASPMCALPLRPTAASKPRNSSVPAACWQNATSRR